MNTSLKFQNTQAATLERQFAKVFGTETKRTFMRDDEKGLRQVDVIRSTDSNGAINIRSEMVRK